MANLTQSESRIITQEFLLQQYKAFLNRQIIIRVSFRFVNLIFLIFVFSISLTIVSYSLFIVLVVFINFTWRFEETNVNYHLANLEKLIPSGNYIEDTYIELRYRAGGFPWSRYLLAVEPYVWQFILVFWAVFQISLYFKK